MMNKRSLFAAVVLLVCFSCKKIVEPTEVIPDGPIQVDATVPGKVWLNVSRQETIYLDARRTSSLNGRRTFEYLWSLKETPPSASVSIQNADQDLAWIDAKLVPGMYTVDLLVRQKDNPAIEARTSYKFEVFGDTLGRYPPRADAGADQVITMPESSVLLDGVGTFKINPNGRAISFAWSLIRKPTGSPSVNLPSFPHGPKIEAENLTEGAYQFGLVITNELGLTSADTVQVTVLPDPLKGTVLLKENLVWERELIDFGFDYLDAVVLKINDPLLTRNRISANTEVRIWDETSQSWWVTANWEMIGETTMRVYSPFDDSDLVAYFSYVGKKTKLEIRFL